jgi:hypothetical protein
VPPSSPESLSGPEPQSGPVSEALTEEQEATLLHMVRVAYPHDRFPDAPYQRTVKIIEESDADGLLPEGIAALNQAAGGDFGSLSEAEATAVLERMSQSPFFKLVHATTVVSLYDDHEVWDILGYEGESFSKGGYLDRGFDDLDWLPQPRVEEYDGPPRVELVEQAGSSGGSAS